MWNGVLILAVLILILGIHRWRCWHFEIQDMIFGVLVSFEFPGFCAYPPCLACPSCLRRSLMSAPGLWWQLWYLFWFWCQRDGFSGERNCQNVCIVHTICFKNQNHKGKFLYLLLLWILWMWWRVCSVPCEDYAVGCWHLSFDVLTGVPLHLCLTWCTVIILYLWCLSLRSCLGLLFWV